MQLPVRVGLFALTGSVFSGCITAGPNYARPEMAPPAVYRDAGDTQARETLADIPWWLVFQDEALQALIRDAIAHNYDLRAAVARVQEARALARVARSFLYPDIGLSAFSGGNQASRNQQPAIVGEDDDRKQQGDDNDGAPEPRRPAEESGDGMPDLRVRSRSRLGDHGLEPDHNGGGRDQHAVDRPPVSPTRLVRSEQREGPRTGCRGGL